MGHLNQLHEDFDAKGLTVLSVTGQARDDVVSFVEDLGASYPIVCKATSNAYSTGGIPSAYLIGADGTVLWQGHPGGIKDDTIEGYLKDVSKSDRVGTWAFRIARNLPEIPAAMAGVDKLLEKMKFGAALKKVDAALPKLEGPEKELGDKVRTFIAGNGEADMEKAATLSRSGDYYPAYLLYSAVAETYKGHDMSKQAKNLAKGLKSGADSKLEIKAFEKLEKIKTAMKGEKKAEDRLKLLKPMLSKKYADTKAGAAAELLAKGLGG